MTLDQAVQSFKSWCQGGDGMDELEFKEYITERYTAEKVLEGKIAATKYFIDEVWGSDKPDEIYPKLVARLKLLQAELSKLKEEE